MQGTAFLFKELSARSRTLPWHWPGLFIQKRVSKPAIWAPTISWLSQAKRTKRSEASAAHLYGTSKPPVPPIEPEKRLLVSFLASAYLIRTASARCSFFQHLSPRGVRPPFPSSHPTNTLAILATPISRSLLFSSYSCRRSPAAT